MQCGLTKFIASNQIVIWCLYLYHISTQTYECCKDPYTFIAGNQLWTGDFISYGLHGDFVVYHLDVQFRSNHFKQL